jgi:hypothetical protein
MGMENRMSNDLYRDRDARLDTVVGDDAAYWAILGRILLDAKDRDILMQDWCEQEHGFRIVYDDEGNITSEPDITDPQKYMLCVLKYGG